ncbi:MAG: hypothetical protein IJM30_10165 [Thermoguttaceae bacterium]|nr:hypothetical protein [Thermoguttaceae bacterium]
MKTLLQELKDEGFEQGIEQGIVKGELRKQLDAIAKLLSYKYGDETGAALRKIGSITNVDLLESIYDLSLRSEGLEQIERYVDEILATNPNATRPLEEILKERGIGR